MLQNLYSRTSNSSHVYHQGQVAVIGRWLLFRGLLQYGKVFGTEGLWPLSGGGRYSEVAAIRRWPLFGGGRYSEVAAIRRWPLFGGGRYSEVAAIRRWPYLEVRLYMQNHIGKEQYSKFNISCETSMKQ